MTTTAGACSDRWQGHALAWACSGQPFARPGARHAARTLRGPRAPARSTGVLTRPAACMRPQDDAGGCGRGLLHCGGEHAHVYGVQHHDAQVVQNPDPVSPWRPRPAPGVELACAYGVRTGGGWGGGGARSEFGAAPGCWAFAMRRSHPSRRHNAEGATIDPGCASCHYQRHPGTQQPAAAAAAPSWPERRPREQLRRAAAVAAALARRRCCSMPRALGLPHAFVSCTPTRLAAWPLTHRTPPRPPCPQHGQVRDRQRGVPGRHEGAPQAAAGAARRRRGEAGARPRACARAHGRSLAAGWGSTRVRATRHAPRPLTPPPAPCAAAPQTRLPQTRNVMFQHSHGKPMSCPATAQLLSNTLYHKRFFPFFTFNLCAGLDEEGERARPGQSYHKLSNSARL